MDTFSLTENHSHTESDPSHLHSNGHGHRVDHRDHHDDHANGLEVTAKYNVNQIPVQGI